MIGHDIPPPWHDRGVLVGLAVAVLLGYFTVRSFHGGYHSYGLVIATVLAPGIPISFWKEKYRNWRKFYTIGHLSLAAVVIIWIVSTNH